jgi:hypothetical protein
MPMRYDVVVFDVDALGLKSLNPGVAEMLQELADLGATLGIISDGAEPNVRARLGVSQHLIDAYACRRSILGIGAKLRGISWQLAAPHNRMVFVSAEPAAIRTASQLGIASAAAGWTTRRHDEFRPAVPTYFVTAPFELVYVLANRPILRLVP